MKPLCVLLHGYPNTPSIWKSQLPELEKIFTIMNLTLPGSESGNVDKEDLKLDKLITSISEKIAQTSSDRIVLVGHDIGAFILSEVTKNLGNKVVAQVYLGGMDFRLFKHRLMTSDQLFKSWYVLVFQTPFIPEKLVPKMQKLLSHAIYNKGPDYSSEAPHGLTPVGLYRELKAGFRRIRNEVRKTQVPTLFLFGEDDRFISAPEINDITKFYDSAELKLIPGGHWFLRESAEAVNSAINNFLHSQNLSGERL